MAFLKNMFGIREIKTPIFYKDFTEESLQLNDLLKLREKVKSDKIEIIDRDIAFLKAGIQGEKNVYYELRNSFIPMICLHDIRIEDGDYIAQLDFIVITAQFIMILETKKLNGDIYINESGDFIRHIKNRSGRVIKKEGIYSPVAQNDRHVRIVKNLLMNKGIIKTLPVISGVVIANEKSIVNKTKAPNKIKHEIFRVDQLTDNINKQIKYYKKDRTLFEDIMKDIAEFFICNNTIIRYDYNAKYSLTENDFIEKSAWEEKITINGELDNSRVEIIQADKIVGDEKIQGSDKEIYNKLKEYRLSKSRELKIKPYFIYSNETLEDIVKVNPRTREDLIKVRGLGEKKINMYGDDIIMIING